MPQFRQDITTRDWVIIATERAKRPEQFIKKQSEKAAIPEFNPECPFCPGNEHTTPPETFSIKNGDAWKVRVIPNKFAAVSPEGEPKREKKGIFRAMPGVGIAEVIIESQKHNLTIGQFSDEEVEHILLAYQQRTLVLSRDHRLELITLFRNHGAAAGASLQHPHSQLIGTPVVPLGLRTKIEVAQSYYDDGGSCVFCDLIQEEIAAKERMVMETEHFVVFEPFASRSPFETWVLPKRHHAGFSTVTPEEIKNLAQVLNATLGKIYRGLSDPDYNYMVHSAPVDEAYADFYHWHVQILPRLTTAAGFELGSGMFINVTLPEEAAKFLRDITA